MTTSEQQQVENSILASSTIESRARALTDFRIRIALIKGLLTNDPLNRANALDKITQLVKTWAKECYPPGLVEGSTAGTVSATTGGKGNVSGVSSPLNNSNNVLVTPISSQRSSVSDGVNPLNSPLFTDGSGSASASSYAASPVVDSGFAATPNTSRRNNSSDEGVYVNEGENKQGCVNQKNATGLQRGEIPDGPASQQQQRRNSADEISANDTENSEERNESMRLLVLAMLRMSIDCPFADVRRSFNKCLNRLRLMGVSVPVPINPSPSFYIAPEDVLTLEWPLEEYTTNSHPPNSSRSLTPSRCSSSSSSSNSSFTEEMPRVIQQPLTPSTPSCLTSLPIGRQPENLVRKLMIDTFIKIGRLSHFYRVLSYFPSFMERYQEAYDVIVRADSGRVPMSWRYYIGIMAASQHKCQYVVSKLTDDFLINGGNIDWLQGLHHAHPKIRKLATLNTILAHQPWRLQTSHINALIRGSSNPQENWAVSEIVHVIVILSTFHSLSSYVLGCGIVPEYDSIGGNYEQPPWTSTERCGSVGILEITSPAIGIGLGVTLDQGEEGDTGGTEESTDAIVTAESSSPINIPKKPSVQPADVETSLKHTNQLIKRLKNKRELQLSSFTSEELDRQISFGSVSSDGSYSFAKIAGFENVEEETFTDDDIFPPSPFPFSQEFFSANDTASHISIHPAYNPPSTNLPEEDFSRFLDSSVEISYADFVVNSPEYNVFKLQDYNWETEGVVMVNKFMPGVGELLDKEFAEIQDFTDYSLFHSYKASNIDLDTTPLRQAIWFYVLRLFGLLKDDYEYRDISTFLNGKIKAFLKKVCCTPEEIQYTDWRNVGFHLRAEEKCHVNLIAVEARKQAELVYGLSCVTRWDSERKRMDRV